MGNTDSTRTYKSVLLLLVLINLTVICLVMGVPAIQEAIVTLPSWMESFPFVGFGFGFLQVTLVIFIFDYYLRAESEERFHSMLLSAPFIKSSLREEKIIEILEASFWRVVKDDDFARDLVDIVKNSAILPDRRIYGMKADITLIDSPNPKNEEFFVARWDISFTEKIAKTRYVFAVAQSNGEYNDLRLDKSVEWRWLQPSNSSVPTPVGNLLEVKHFSLDGAELSSRASTKPNRVEFKTPSQLIGKEVQVRYVVEVFCRKRSHLIFYSFDYPTQGYEISFDYSKASVDFVNIVDSLTTPTAPDISYFPDSLDPYRSHRIRVSDRHEWIIPKSAIAFVWRLPDA